MACCPPRSFAVRYTKAAQPAPEQVIVQSTAGQHGSGSDGVLTASSGTTTLTRDTFYSAINLSGTAEIYTASFKLYCSGRVKRFGSARIHCDGANGGNGGTGPGTGGTAGAAPPAGTTLDHATSTGAGGAGGAGHASNGDTAGGTPATVVHGWGGKTIAAGTGTQGGQGSFGNTSSGGGAGAVTNQYRVPEVPTHDMLAPASAALGNPAPIRAGAGGPGGSSGRGFDADGISGSGGGGGGAAGCLWFSFAEYETDETSQPGGLSAKGGKGGNGGNAVQDATTDAVGAGNGAGGGSGGVVKGIIGKRIGGPVEGEVDISGGNGGNGGTGAGTTGGTLASGGSGGPGGGSGQAFILNLETGEAVISRWANAGTAVVPVVASNPPNLAGAAGNPATVTRLDL